MRMSEQFLVKAVHFWAQIRGHGKAKMKTHRLSSNHALGAGSSRVETVHGGLWGPWVPRPPHPSAYLPGADSLCSPLSILLDEEGHIKVTGE